MLLSGFTGATSQQKRVKILRPFALEELSVLGESVSVLRDLVDLAVTEPYAHTTVE